MHREIMTFLQMSRAFLQHTGHYCCIQKIILSATEPGSAVGLIFPSATSSQLSNKKEVQCKSNRLKQVKTIVIQKLPDLWVNVPFALIFYL